MAHIYKITNLINNKIYIGQTVKYLSVRFSNHKYNAKVDKECKNYFYRAIRKHGMENFKIESIISGDFNKELLNELEKHYIQLYNSNNYKIGYNSTKGGDGGLGYKMSEERKLQVSKQFKGNKYQLGRKASEETKKKLSEFQKNRIRSKEQYEKISKSLTGRKVTLETRIKQSLAKIGKNLGKDNHNYISEIYQFDKNMKFIKCWETIKDVCDNLNIKRSALSMNLNGSNKTTGGFIFKYKIRCQE